MMRTSMLLTIGLGGALSIAPVGAQGNDRAGDNRVQAEEVKKFRAFLNEDWKRWMQEYPEAASFVAPPAILPGKSDKSRRLGIFLHPALPIFIEKGAELFHLFCLNAVVSCSVVPLRTYGRNRQRTTKPYCQQHRCSHHASLLAACANSLSRSSASLTFNRAVSSIPIPVLSTSTASAARTSGETFRSRSRLSRSITSSKTSGSVSRSPFS